MPAAATIRVVMDRMMESSCLFTSESRNFLHRSSSSTLNRQRRLENWLMGLGDSSKKERIESLIMKKGITEKI